MKRFHHGHSLGAGVLFGLLLSRRPELIFAAGLATGVALMYTRNIAHWLALVLEDSRRRFVRRTVRPFVVATSGPGVPAPTGPVDDDGDDIPY